jgi:deazaflavin-dependent oxidoreductase (nitroreductase family)
VVNPLNWLAHRLGRYPVLMKVRPVVLPLDRVLHRVSRGRVSLVGMAGMPSLRLVTTGRKTGLARVNDLLYTPYGDDFVVIGSGWGQPKHPAWTANLLSDPTATVIVRGREIPVTARAVEEGAERDEIWAQAVRVWPGYTMERGIADREFRIFVLTERR